MPAQGLVCVAVPARNTGAIEKVQAFLRENNIDCTQAPNGFGRQFGTQHFFYFKEDQIQCLKKAMMQMELEAIKTEKQTYSNDPNKATIRERILKLDGELHNKFAFNKGLKQEKMEALITVLDLAKQKDLKTAIAEVREKYSDSPKVLSKNSKTADLLDKIELFKPK